MAKEITSYDEVSTIDKATQIFLTKDGALGKKSIQDVGNVINGTTDISTIGDGTVTGAIGTINNNKLDKTSKGASGGLAELDNSGKVPSSQLPSYVDDVVEYDDISNFPETGESGKIYIDTTANLSYRWTGSGYREISQSLGLGETSSTAYRGDRGKIAYEHSQSTHARTDATKVEKSSTNGNIKINGEETNVYTHPEKHSISDVSGLQDTIDDINSNLDTLAFGLESGSSNIIECEDISFLANTNKEIKIFELNLKAGTYTFSWTQATTLTSITRNTPFYTKNSSRIYMDGSENYNLKEDRYKWTFTLESDSYIEMYYWCHTPNTDVAYKDFKLELGTQATPYEPYIPSVKMLAEENAQQNTEAMDLKMLGWTVPRECPIQNEVSGNQFIQKVGRVDLGTHNFAKSGDAQSSGQSTYKTIASYVKTNNVYVYGFTYSSIGEYSRKPNTINNIPSSLYNLAFTVKTSDYADAKAFDNAMNGKYLYYELDTPITMTIDGNEVTERLNESLEDYGLDNKCPELGQGYCNFSGSDNGFVWVEQETTFVGIKSPIDCVSGNIVKVKFDITPNNIVIQWNNGTHSRVDNEKEIVATVPIGVTKFCTYCSKTALSLQEVGNVRIYVNNAIDEIKNDLDAVVELGSDITD